MINIAPDAQQLLQTYMHRHQLTGLRLISKGDRCQGVEIEASWLKSEAVGDVKQICGELTVFIHASLADIVNEIQISLGSTPAGPSLLFTPQYAACECSSSSCGESTMSGTQGA